MEEFGKIDPKELAESLTGITMPDDAPDPYFNWSFGNDRYIFSVSNLDWMFVHKGGKMLYQGAEKNPNRDIRIHRVVEYDTGILYYRLCGAMQGYDYDAFIVAWFNPLSEKKSLLDKAKTLAPLTMDEMHQKLSEPAVYKVVCGEDYAIPDNYVWYNLDNAKAEYPDVLRIDWIKVNINDVDHPIVKDITH